MRPGGLWREISVAEQTGSTNADLVARAIAGGAPEGLVLVAENRPRAAAGSAALSPPRAALTFSVLVRPQGVPPARRGWLPLLAGVATATAVRQVSGLGAQLKWPNGACSWVPGNWRASWPNNQDAVGRRHRRQRVHGRDELPPATASSRLLPATSLRLEGAASLDRAQL